MEETEVRQTVKKKRVVKTDSTRKQIRGSSLLLAGKFISVGLHFVTQVLIVRYLSKSDYGSWAYAMAVIAFFRPFATVGLKRSITRFIPIYHEREQYDKLLGTMALVVATILLTGMLIIGMVYVSPELISRLISGDQQPVSLLLILIFLVPVRATDGMLIGLFACFASPRAIFTRKHLVAPILKFIVVLSMIHLGSTVVFLAYGYLLSVALGVLIYSGVFVRILRKQGLFEHLNLNAMTIPAKEIFAFTIPLLTSDLVTVIMHSSDAFILGYFHGTTAVAMYRVILPAAHFNKMVMESFALLFTPLAARLFAKHDFLGINKLYWQTAIWMGVFTFPIFVLTFSMAKPLTLFLYGARYEQSWVYLQLLAFAYYFNVALGFNGLTLKVLGKVRYVVIINVLASILNVIGNLLLIPKYGALGATIATAVSMVVHNILKQAGLRMASGVSIFNKEYLSIYLIISISAFGLFMIQFYRPINIYIALLLVSAVSLLVLRLCSSKLRIEETFPELLRLPLINLILRSGSKSR
ncbi:MAG: flippase [bacterium]